MKPLMDRRVATAGLFCVTLLWGGTFVWMKLALNAANSQISIHGATAVAAVMVSFRFAIGLILLLLLSKRARHALTSVGDWKGGGMLGGVMLLGYLIQMIGLDDISASVSAFLTSLYVVFTTILSTKFSNQRLTRMMIIGALFATFGAGFIDGPPHLVWGWGELLTVLSAFFFAAHIILTDSVTKKYDPIGVSATSFATVCVGGAAIALVSGEIQVVNVVVEDGVFTQLMLLGIFGTFVCLVILNLCQKSFHPTHAAIIYAFEPVWATLYALGIEMIEVSAWLVVGGLAVLLGNILVEFENRDDDSEE